MKVHETSTHITLRDEKEMDVVVIVCERVHLMDYPVQPRFQLTVPFDRIVKDSHLTERAS